MTPARPPLWAQALALSALSDRRFVPVALALLFAVLGLRAVLEPFGDQDALWIAAAGRQMLASGDVPRTNGWGIADAAMPWVMHEWALGPLYAALVSGLGLAGPVCLGLTAAAGTTLMLARGTLGTSRHLAAGALACLFALATVRECLFQPRPAYVVLALPLAAIELAFRPRFQRTQALAFVGLTWLWTNLHGSFSLALVILGLAAGVLPTDRRARALALAAAALATLANPYGAALHELVDRYLRGGDASSALIHAHIAEFQPLWAAGPVFGGAMRVVPLGIVTLVALLGLRGSDRVVRGRIVLALAMVGLAVLHARHVPQALLTSTVLLMPVLDRWLDRARLPASDAARSSLLRTLAAYLAIGLTLLLALATVREIHADAALGGDALPALARDPRAVGRALYVPFDASGRLTWHALPRGSVLFDPRNDCYSAETITTAVALEQGDCVDACAVDALASHGVTAAIVSEEHPTYAGLVASGAFRRARTLDGWTLFVRDGAPAAR